MSQESYDYVTRKGIRPISWEDFHGICKGLVSAIAEFNPEIVLAIGRGGYYPGTLIAHMLRAEIYPIRLSRRVNDTVQHKSPQWLLKPPDMVRSRRILIVDEICDTGETLTLVKAEVARMEAKESKSAVLYAHTWGVSIPDCIGLITDELLLNPWDREIFRDGKFQFHPEYAGALKQQGYNIDPALLIPAKTFKIAKG